LASATAAVEAPGWRARSITLALNSSECRRQPRLAGLAAPGLVSMVSMCPRSCVWTQASSTSYADSRWVGRTHTKPVHIHYPLAILPGQEEASFDVQLQHLMERKRTLAKNLLAAPACTKQDYADLLRNTVG
jgi:hypothetical protein